MTQPNALVSLPGLPALRVVGEVLPPEREVGIPYRRWESSGWTAADAPLTPEQDAEVLAPVGELNDAAMRVWQQG